MTTSADTIIALCTPASPSALAVIRMSGPQTFTILKSRWKGKDPEEMKSHTVSLGYILDADNNPIDNVVITKFVAPASFTGENTIEISAHGSPWITAAITRSLIQAGARHAQHGEFSKRAFLNGRLDLAQAEAVADIIAASSTASSQLAIRQLKGELSKKINSLSDELIHLCSLLELELDFSEEDVTFAPRTQLLELCESATKTLSDMEASYASGSAFKEGIPVAIAGIPNAGKSTLLNAILKDDRAIVSDIPGTTRDIIEDTIEIDGILFRFSDTAGLRDTSDAIEKTGIERTVGKINKSKILILMIDATMPIDPQIQEFLRHTNNNIASETVILPVINKTDIAEATQLCELPNNWLSPIRISAKLPDTIKPLLDKISDISKQETDPSTTLFITNQRHYSLVVKAKDAITRAADAIRQEIPGDLISQDIRYALDQLAEITGRITSTDILHSIFSSFCIGK